MAIDLAELARRVDLKPEAVEQMLRPFRLAPQNVDWQPLEVPRGKEMTLRADSPEFLKSLVQLKVESVDDIREWMGIPARAFQRKRPTATAAPPAGGLAAVRPVTSSSVAMAQINPGMTIKIPKDALTSISPKATMKELDAEKRVLLHAAARNLVYGDPKSVSMDSPLYQAALEHLKVKLLPIHFLLNITVNAGATLNIHPSVASVSAFRIKIYKTGRIKTPSYVSFHCYSIEGGL